jgi:hypothetical protein
MLYIDTNSLCGPPIFLNLSPVVIKKKTIGIDHMVNLKTKVPLFTMGGLLGVVLVLLSRECRPTFFSCLAKWCQNSPFTKIVQ